MFNKVYFGEKGYTSTSANYIANKAKEYCQDLEQNLQNLEFFSTSINLIGTNDVSIISNGIGSTEWIPTAIDTIGKCNSLIAWLREAIKEREKAINAIKKLDIKEYAKFKDITLPDYPTQEDALTEEEYYASLPIKERNRYYSLEAQAAALGKYIHQNGSLNRARKKLFDKIQNPHEVSGSGRDAIIYNYEPSIFPEEADELFFKLQNKHREIQAQLNSIKFECEKAVKDSEIKVRHNYRVAYQNHINTLQNIENEMKLYIEEQTKFLGDLKIVIPNELKDICDEISNLGK